MRRVTITIGYDETEPELIPSWVPKSALLEGYSVKLEVDGKILGTSVVMSWKEASATAMECLHGGDLPKNEEEEDNAA